MSVYLDTARNPLGRMLMCHMIADTPDELHAMAERIGMARAWYQVPHNNPAKPPVSFPHYDVSCSRRVKALKAGAIELERREFVLALRRVRLRIIDEVGFAETWR